MNDNTQIIIAEGEILAQEECSICKSNIIDCYAYPCLHTICSECVNQLQIHNKTLFCWICRTKINHIASVQSNNLVLNNNINENTSLVIDPVIEIEYQDFSLEDPSISREINRQTIGNVIIIIYGLVCICIIGLSIFSSLSNL
jgi:hypothetical protein